MSITIQNLDWPNTSDIVFILIVNKYYMLTWQSYLFVIIYYIKVKTFPQ